MFNDELLGFIHEPARLSAMVHLASVKRADFVFLLAATELSRGNLSVQMRKLAERGLIEIEKIIEDNRPRTLYQITPFGRKALRKYRKAMVELLEALPS